MSDLIAEINSTSTATESRIGFMTEGGGNWRIWDRFITLDGKKAYHIGNICGTCAFFFERLEGANDKVSPAELTERFRAGLRRLDPEILSAITAALPAGDYIALLLTCNADRVMPAEPGDYFREEQISLWGVDGFWGLPHYTKTEYYRADSIRMPDKRGFFEFIVPMFPSNYLQKETVESYKGAIRAGSMPTALAVSVLDVKQPADWKGSRKSQRIGAYRITSWMATIRFLQRLRFARRFRF